MNLRRRHLALGAAIALGGAGLGLLSRAAGRSPAPAQPPDDRCISAPLWPHDPASGLALLAPRPLPATARCPVCGMFPARAPSWAAQAIFTNGDTQFLDSPLSLFIYLDELPRHAHGRSVAELAVSYVRDHEDGRWLDAAAAHYVQGSDVLGPMRGGNLPAFASAARALAFAARHGGEVRVADAVDRAALRRLLGRSAHAH